MTESLSANTSVSRCWSFSRKDVNLPSYSLFSALSPSFVTFMVISSFFAFSNSASVDLIFTWSSSASCSFLTISLLTVSLIFFSSITWLSSRIIWSLSQTSLALFASSCSLSCALWSWIVSICDSYFAILVLIRWSSSSDLSLLCRHIKTSCSSSEFRFSKRLSFCSRSSLFATVSSSSCFKTDILFSASSNSSRTPWMSFFVSSDRDSSELTLLLYVANCLASSLARDRSWSSSLALSAAADLFKDNSMFAIWFCAVLSSASSCSLRFNVAS